MYAHASLTRARLSHAEERVWSNSYTDFVLLSKQQRMPRIEKRVTVRHDSVEIVRAKKMAQDFLKLFKKVDVGLAIRF